MALGFYAPKLLSAAGPLAIQADILSNLGSGEVRATALAQRHGVTPRYIHKLFESEGPRCRALCYVTASPAFTACWLIFGMKAPPSA
jgi:hypothetical protein